MLAQRLIVVIVLIPIGALVIAAGGWVLATAAAAVLGFAAWEYWRMFKTGGFQPSAPVLVGSVALLVFARQAFNFSGSDVLLTAFVLITMTVQIAGFGRGSTTSANDFNITLGGILYLGWLGSYLISVRNLPDGMWWLLLVLPATWFGDGAAYFVGSHFGRHKMFPKISPKKSWEGYLGGVAAAALGCMLLASLWQLQAPQVTPIKGLIVGLVIGVISPLGDFGESMLKRSFGLKDTSQMIPGHGGIMDRIDSWLWAGAIGYYLILWAWM